MNPSKHILIVDDEPNVRLVFRTALTVAGYTLTTVENGEQALDALKQLSTDLVLLDLKMPVMGGMELLAKLRDAGSEVPVVIVTAHGSVPDAVKALKLGAIDILSKPVTPEALRRVVAEVLERHTETSAQDTRPHVAPNHVTAATEFASNLRRAKRALNHRWFDEAEVFLKQAIALRSDSAEALNLMGVLHEFKGEHDASYRQYKAALKADKHYEPAKANMTRYYERFTFGKSEVPVNTGDN